MKVETAAFLRIVDVEEFLESFHDLLYIRLATLGRFDVEDLAGLVEGQAGRSKGICGSTIAFGPLSMFGGRRGLFVRFSKSSTEHTGAGENDLGDYAMGL